MARITRVVNVFSSQTITSSGTLDSSPIDIGRAAYFSYQYDLSTSTTGLYNTGTCQILLSSNNNTADYVLPKDADNNFICNVGNIDSTNKYVRFSVPVAQYMKFRIVSRTDNTQIFDNVWVSYDELN